MIRLVPMTAEDYQQFMAWAVPDYAQQQVKAGYWSPEGSTEKAEKVFEGLIPEGLATASQSFYVIEDEETGRQIGYMWSGVRDEGDRPFVVLYDLVILEPYRRQGFGRQALSTLEDKVLEQGLKRIALHVFGHNEGARALYWGSGYTEKSITMAKELD